MNTPTTDAPSGWSPLMIGGVALGGLVLLLLLIPTFRSPGSKSQSPDGQAATDGADVSRSQCERWLDSAIDGLQPTRLGLSSENRVMADTLNNWLSQCVGEAPPVAEAGDADLRKTLLTADGFARSESERYQTRDADHVRNCLLARAIVDRVTTDLRTDRERTLELFYYIVRTVDLAPSEGPDLRLTPYESLLYGMGTSADRAWTYALLMRQLRLDVVMLQPRVAGDTPYWLVGVIVPGEGVLLLDPRLGLPITALADSDNPQTPLPTKVATLSDVRQNDGLLRQYDQADRKYPLSAKDFETVDVFGIGTSSAFAPRMGRLQAELPEAVELYDGLSANELREHGLVDRLIAAGRDGLWSEQQVHIWPYPELHWGEDHEFTEEERRVVDALEEALNGPYAIAIEVTVDEESNNVTLEAAVEKHQRGLRLARIEELMGNFETAQQGYLQARLNQVNYRQAQEYARALMENVQKEAQSPQQVEQIAQEIQQQLAQKVEQALQNVPEIRSNALAADMATFWAAQSQYERQDYRVAAESAVAYIQRPGGAFAMPGIYLASISLSQDGRPAQAADLLARQPLQVPQSLGNQALVERWRLLSDPNYKRKASPTKSAPTTEKEPASAPKAAPADNPPTADAPADKPQAEPAPAEKPAADETNDSELPRPPAPDLPARAGASNETEPAAP